MKSAQEIRDEVNALLKTDALKMGNDPSLVVEYIPTGVLPFDVLLGGGLPLGRTVEIFGDFSTLKSYLALKAIAAVQAQGKIAGLIDTEHVFDPVWAETLGVNTKDLLLQQPDQGEAAVAATEVMVRMGATLVVWDSVAATLPKAYAEAKPGEDQQPARLASLMSKALQRLTAANTKTCLLFINQTRLNVGVRFGSPETAPGGRALPFYASLRIKTSKGGKITEDLPIWNVDKMMATKSITAFQVKATVEKSKLNRPHREVWFVFDLNQVLIDEIEFIISTGLVEGIITKSGAFWTIPNVMDFKIQGSTKFKEYIAQDPEVREWLAEQILSKTRGTLVETELSPGKAAGRRRKKGVVKKPAS